MPPLPEIIARFASRYNPEHAPGFHAVIHLVLKGSEPGEFTLTLSEAGCEAQSGLQGTPDCEVRTSSEAFRRIAQHERSAEEEFIMGNIAVSNLQVILRIGRAFR